MKQSCGHKVRVWPLPLEALEVHQASRPQRQSFAMIHRVLAALRNDQMIFCTAISIGA